VIVVTMSAYQAYAVNRYVADALARGLSNDAYFRLANSAADERACGERLFIEDVGRPLTGLAWVGLYTVDYVLTLSGCTHRLLTVDHALGALTDADEAWAVLSAATVSRWSPRWHAEPRLLMGAPAGQDLIPIGLYRLTRVR
jgi:hypothetical protein